MIPKIKSVLNSINPKSSKFIITAIFIVLILLTLLVSRSQVGQITDNKNTASAPTPTPTLTPGKDYAEGQIVVKFKEGISDTVINEHLAKYNARIKSTISGINVKIVEVPVGQEENIRKELSEEPFVKYAELDQYLKSGFIPNDPNFGIQWGLKNTGQVIEGQKGTPKAHIQAEQAWDITKGGGVKVAVLDTGIDPNHPDFADRIVAQQGFATDYIDDKSGHGTHVAGIIAASTNNGQGIAGVCPECQLMIGKITGDDDRALWTDSADGVIWATDNGAHIINMSQWGPNFPEVIQEAVNYAWGKGMIVVSIAGNKSGTEKYYPGALDYVVTVGSTDNNDQKSSFSTYGDWVDITAPGTKIFSTFPTTENAKGPTDYGYLSGTSMAAPMVAGVAALIRSTQYGSTNQAAIDRLYATADKIPGTGEYWIHGRVNAAAAVGVPPPTVSGHVYDSAGKGVSGVAVSTCTLGNATTDSSGFWQVSAPYGSHFCVRVGSDCTYKATNSRTGSCSYEFQISDRSCGQGETCGPNEDANDRNIDSGYDFKASNTTSQPTPTATPGPTVKINPTPTAKVTPPGPHPTFYCGGSKESICVTPTVHPHPTKDPKVTNQPLPTVTGEPIIDPNVTPVPENDCIDPRNAPERIGDWLKGFLKKVDDYIKSILGNPQGQRPEPPRPCIVR